MAGEENPPGDKGGGEPISDMLLGVVNWWCLKFGKTEVVDLVMRHFEHAQVYSSCVTLAELCGLSKPINHKNTASRPALVPCASDLVKIMKDLVESKQVPNIAIPVSDLGKVPFDALSIRDERSVSSRLESLESSVQSVVAAVEKLTSLRNPATVPMPEVTVSASPTDSTTDPSTVQTFANVAAKFLQPNGHSNHAGPIRQPVHSVAGGNLRSRSRSPQVKRGPDGNAVEDSDGFRRQGRPRYQNRQAASGASKVVVEDVGELQPSLQYYIGNTPGKANEEIIRKILEKCAAPLLGDTRGPLVIESVHCLTKDPDPRTKCWRVVVPPGFKDIMENSLMYPEGWRYREFVGIFRNSNKTVKKFRMSDNSIVDQVMAESNKPEGQRADQLLHSLHQQVLQLVQQQAAPPTGQPDAQALQG